MTAVSVDSKARTAERLGYLALLPFVIGAALVWLVGTELRPMASRAVSAYAAVVISFIGAIHWGLGFSQQTPATRLFVWGVIPSLVACAAVLVPPRSGLAVHAAMLVVCYLVDRHAYADEGIARWLPLRLRLTVVAALGCLAAALGS